MRSLPTLTQSIVLPNVLSCFIGMSVTGSADQRKSGAFIAKRGRITDLVWFLAKITLGIFRSSGNIANQLKTRAPVNAGAFFPNPAVSLGFLWKWHLLLSRFRPCEC